LQLAAGDWERAEQSYRSLVQANPADPALLIGLARAQSGMGKYLAAERTFRRALNAGSTDTAVVKELELLTSINQADPTLRGLESAEKHRRNRVPRRIRGSLNRSGSWRHTGPRER
jgi:Flp pilus assembly protein TadD